MTFPIEHLTPEAAYRIDRETPYTAWRRFHSLTDALLGEALHPVGPVLTARIVHDLAELHDYVMSVIVDEFHGEVVCMLEPIDNRRVLVFDPGSPAGGLTAPAR